MHGLSHLLPNSLIYLAGSLSSGMPRLTKTCLVWRFSGRVHVRYVGSHLASPSSRNHSQAHSQSIAWLHDRYFLPTLYPARSTLVVPPFLRSVVPLLDQYKSLQKQIIGDTTLAKTRASEVAAIYRDIERWIGEAKVAAISDRSDGAFGSGASRRRQPTETATESEDEEDMEDSRRERWALVQLSEALCNRGALVPTSKKCVPLSQPVGPRLLTVVSGSGTYPKAESFYQSRSSLFGHLSWNRFEFGTLY
jgi:hypothetical protein